MSNDGMLVLEMLFQIVWRLFTSWHIPGTNVTPAGAGLFFLSAGIGLRFVLGFLGNPGNGFSGGMAGRNRIASWHNRGTGRKVNR